MAAVSAVNAAMMAAVEQSVREPLGHGAFEPKPHAGSSREGCVG